MHKEALCNTITAAGHQPLVRGVARELDLAAHLAIAVKACTLRISKIMRLMFLNW